MIAKNCVYLSHFNILSIINAVSQHKKMPMKKYFTLLLFMTVTSVVFSRPVDRPPDIDNVKIEITQQNDFICPVVIDEPILMVSETIYQPKEMPTILTSIENKGDVQKGKAITIHLKKSGTDNEQDGNLNYYNIKSVAVSKISGEPKIRSPVLANQS